MLEPWFELRSKDISESVSMSFRSMLEKVIKPPLVARERHERDTSVLSIPPGIPLTVVPAILSIARLSTLLKVGAELWPPPVFLCSLWMLRSFVLADHDVSTHFFLTSRQSLSPFPLMKLIETQTFCFTSLVIPGLNLPFRTVVLFPASCIMTWTSSAVKFRLLSFFTTFRGSFFFFFVFPFPDAELTMVIDVAWLGSDVVRSASAAAMVIDVP